MFMNDLLTSALAYASLGYRVLPCHSVINGICTCGGRPNCKPGKHPLTPHGFKDATRDEATIKAWWADLPYANVGIATGEGVWVLDEDPRHDGDKTLAALIAEHGALPLTPTVRSGGGGRQYYLHYPEGVVIRFRAGVAQGLDVRGDSGLVIAPPSAHVSGNRYEWLTPIETPLADAPDWLLAVVAETFAARGNGSGLTLTMGAAASDFSSHPGAERGTQNDTMCRLLGIHISRGDSPATVEALALAWAARCDPPISEHEVYSRLRWAESKRTEGLNRFLVGGDDRSEGFLVSSPESERTNSNADADEVEDQGDMFVSSHAGNADILVEGSDPSPNPKHLSPHEATDEKETSLPSDDWPKLHADTLHGLAGAIVKAVAPESEADPAGILLTLLAAFGNAVGKGPHFSMNAGVHHTNLFVALVGDSASGKGQAWSVVQRLMEAADPDWEAEAPVYGLSSGEGLVDRVKDEEEEESTDQTPSLFVMRRSKRLFCVETEFAKPLVSMRREGNTLSPLLRSAWDAQVLEVLTRGKSKLRASDALVSVVAHITPEELEKLLGKSVEVTNGFVNRFLWGCVRRSKLLPEGGDPSVLDAFVEPLREALANAETIGRVERDADAKALWAGEYEGLSCARPGAFGMATGRAHAQTLRLSLLYALLDGSDVIRVEHLRAALSLWRYCEASARRIFGLDAASGSGDRCVGGRGSTDTPPLPLHLRLLDIIVKTPGISRKGLPALSQNCQPHATRRMRR